MQSINLYQVEIKEKVVLCLNQILQLGAVLVALLFLSTLYELYGYYSLQKEFNSLNANQKDLSLGLDHAQKKVVSEQDKKEVASKVSILQNSLREKEQMYYTLTTLQHGDEKGFHQYLKALSDNNIPELWLTHFYLGTNGSHISVSGKTVSPNKIPELIKKVGEHESFKNIVFEVFNLEKEDDDSGVISFKLETIQ